MLDSVDNLVFVCTCHAAVGGSAAASMSMSSFASINWPTFSLSLPHFAPKRFEGNCSVQSDHSVSNDICGIASC